MKNHRNCRDCAFYSKLFKNEIQLTCSDCAYFNKGLNIDLDSCGLGEDYCNRDCPACCLFEDSGGLDVD